MNNRKLKQVQKANFLVVIIDDKLNWKSQVDKIKTKISKFIGMFYNIRDSLNINALKLVYFSLVYPHLHYGSAIWGGALKTDLDNLLVIQKKC